MNRAKRWCLLMALYLSSQLSFGQSKSVDANWHTATTLDDEFPGGSSGTLNTTNWTAGNGAGYGNVCPNTSNVTITSMTTPSGDNSAVQLQINSSTNTCGYTYSTGEISSNSMFKFGYYEGMIEMNVNGYPLPANEAYDEGFFLYAGCAYGSPPTWPVAGLNYTNEIDCEILTSSGVSQPDYTQNIHINNTPGTSCSGTHQPFSDCANLYWLSSSAETSFHKYAFEWTPDHLIWYFDDVPIFMERNYPSFSDPNSGGIPQNSLAMIIDPWLGGVSWPTGANVPQSMYLDYVRIYPIYTSGTGCSSLNSYSATTTTFNQAAFNQLYSNITVTSSSTTASIPSTDNTFMRATGTTTIYGPFTVNVVGHSSTTPLVPQFGIIPTQCQ